MARRPTGRRRPGSPGRRALRVVAPPAGDPRPSFPIVGVGASAGGLEAFRQLLAHVPADAGLALVLVQHLDSTRASLLSDALAPATAMKVAQAEDGVRVEPNRVYVIPPGVQMAVEGGALRLSPLDASERRPHLPIDFFFTSLAAERGRQAIGVVLSGIASDGTAGLAAIRAHGGITFAQEPGTARFAEMPQRAFDAGAVDFCLPLPALGAELARLAVHPYVARQAQAPAPPVGAATLSQVVGFLRGATGVDFGEHKPGTLKRRLARRMAIRQTKDLAAYLEVLRQDPAEVQAIYNDLLIKVTSFFRDAAAFEDLRRIAVPELLKHKAPGAPLRAWVVGCATGEEVYSVAIALLEALDDAPAAHPVVIFGSDLSEKAIEFARAGLYPEGALSELGEARRDRFFVRAERGWRVSQAVRERCIFVRHDVAHDPPFSKLDLLSCRNVLIYFGRTLQRRVLETAHYALNPSGYLMLGSSESAASAPRWFVPARRGGHLYRRKTGPSAFRIAPRAGTFPFSTARAGAEATPPRPGGGLARKADDLVLARYGPAGVMINDRLEVLQFRGRTGRYLEIPEGEPEHLLLKLARPGLAGPLRIALAQARRTAAPVRKEGICVEGPGQGPACDLVVLPVRVTEGDEAAFLVLFEARPAATPAAPGRRGGRAAPLSSATRRALEEELASTREHLAALLEEHHLGNEALALANAELVSGNEELQSLNEELETAKEEVQATNEELTTVNDELHGRNQELQRVNSDVFNLLDTVEIPILMLDEGRCLRRFTRRASTFLELSPTDLGRRISDLDLPLHAPDLETWITRAMKEVTLVEAEVHDRSDRWHRLQIRPHLAADGHADGAILSLVDIDELRHEITLARWARDYARSIVEAVQLPLVVMDGALNVLSANAAYYRRFRERPADTEGRSIFELGGGEWDAPELRRAVASVVGGKGAFQDVELERDFPGAGRRAVRLSGSAIPAPVGAPMCLLAVEDVTERLELTRRRAELLALSVEAQRRAEQADRAKDLFLATLSHELRAPLSTILLHAQSLEEGRLEAPAVVRAASRIAEAARRQSGLIEDLVDISSIVAGKVSLDLEALDLRVLVENALEAARPTAEASGLVLGAALDGAPLRCRGDAARLHQIVSNLLGNAIKFTPRGGRVDVRLDAFDGQLRLVVTDTGRGIAPAFLPHVFERFSQEDGAGTPHRGLGLGLAIVEELIRLHGGTVRAESPGRAHGSTFTITLPRDSAPPPASG